MINFFDSQKDLDNWDPQTWDPEEFSELVLSELDNIAGGRELRPSEIQQIKETQAQVSAKMQRLINSGNHKSAKEYMQACCSCFEQYKSVIAKEPEDGPDIPLGRYLNP